MLICSRGNCQTTRPRFVGQSSLPCFPLCHDTFRPIECARLRLLLSGSLALWLPAPLVFLPLPVPGGVALCLVHLLGGILCGGGLASGAVRLFLLSALRRCSVPCLSSADFLQLPGLSCASSGRGLPSAALAALQFRVLALVCPALPSVRLGVGLASFRRFFSSSRRSASPVHLLGRRSPWRWSCFRASLGAALGWWRVGLAPCQHGYQFPAPL